MRQALFLCVWCEEEKKSLFDMRARSDDSCYNTGFQITRGKVAVIKFKIVNRTQKTLNAPSECSAGKKSNTYNILPVTEVFTT